ncbi:MAG: hypothetical protein F4Z28_17125 [Gammaproteobacteria bacterium]|nr:hypothetical protein [Gammaproteobacteria bacterium]
MAIELVITADDRTGALETGGACADLGFDVRLTTAPDMTDDCAVIDLDSRHCAAVEAARRIDEAHRLAARFRCHKMDSGLRGNWAHETASLIALGRRVGILASFPDAGRRCDDGTVYIRDVPVAESPFGRDPRNRLLSSRPVDYLRAAGCETALADGRLVVLDANTNDELNAAAVRCRDEDRMLVGTTGGVGAYVATLRSGRRGDFPPLPRPALVVCGSLHPLSRTQISRLPFLTVGPDDDARRALAALQGGEDVVLATEMTGATIADAAAESMASLVAATTWHWIEASGAPTVMILGGDTAAAVLGDRTLRVLGSADTAVPLCQTEDRRLAVVTKGGGIGEENTLARLLPPAVGLESIP